MLFSTPLAYAVMFAPLIYIFFFNRNLMSMDKQQAILHLGIFAALNGLSLGSIFLVYTSASIVKTFLITASTFGAMSLYGYSTKKDLTALGSFVYMGLIGLIIASLINLFLRSAALDFVVSFIGVGIFTALTAYDTQKLKSIYYTMNGTTARASNIAVYGALTLYLDFINLFTMLLHFVGVRKSDD
jgi:FtsH-binding integral membrane protein